MKSEKIGTTIENPIKLNSIRASFSLLNNIVTDNCEHILYHRIGSEMNKTSKYPIDHYVLCTDDGERSDVYIDIYNDKN